MMPAGASLFSIAYIMAFMTSAFPTYALQQPQIAERNVYRQFCNFAKEATDQSRLIPFRPGSELESRPVNRNYRSVDIFPPQWTVRLSNTGEKIRATRESGIGKAFC